MIDYPATYSCEINLTTTLHKQGGKCINKRKQTLKLIILTDDVSNGQARSDEIHVVILIQYSVILYSHEDAINTFSLLSAVESQLAKSSALRIKQPVGPMLSVAYRCLRRMPDENTVVPSVSATITKPSMQFRLRCNAIIIIFYRYTDVGYNRGGNDVRGRFKSKGEHFITN